MIIKTLELEDFAPHFLISCIRNNTRSISYGEIEEYGKKVVSQLKDTVLYLNRYSTYDFLNRYSQYFTDMGEHVEIKNNVAESDLIDEFYGKLTVELAVALNKADTVKNESLV